MHKLLGFPIFLFVMLLGFYTTTKVGLYCQDWLDDQLTTLLNYSLHLIENRYLMLIFKSFATSLIIVISLIPVIAILFIFLALLEDSGYIPRITVLLDNTMSKLGLCGKSFIPIILGFGCNVPALMAIRTIESQTQRIKLAMMIPFMSCSARLTIFSIFTVLLFEQHQGLIIFSLYLIGMLIGIATAYIAGRMMNEKAGEFFIYEIPALSFPNPAVILRKAYIRVRSFAMRASKLIITFSFIIILINEVIASGEHKDYMQNLGEKANYVFAPLGIAKENWQFPYVLFSGVIAKEAMLASINSLYNIENDTKLKATLGAVFTDWRSVYAMLVLILLYFPCVSVFSVQGREFGYKIAILSMVWSLMIGYILAIISYQMLLMF